MRNTLSAIVLVFILATISSCNSEKHAEQQQTGQQSSMTEPSVNIAADSLIADDATHGDTTQPYVDSFRIQMDSLMKARIALPPVYQHEIVEANDEATDKFSKLSKACNGKMKILVNSDVVVEELNQTIKSISVRESDLLIIIDKTYSMTNDINNVKTGLNQILDTIRKYKGTRLAIAFYGDKNSDGKSWYSFRNFETKYDSAIKYLNDVVVGGGGDWPESVYDAVMLSLESNFWKSSKRCNIILVGDAPPLEKPLSDHTLEDIVKKSKERKIKMNFYPILIMPGIHQVKILPEEIQKYKEIKSNTVLYPNPNKGILNLSMNTTATYYIELYNSAGVAVLNEEFYGITWTRDIRHLPNGMYIVRVINTDRTFEVMKFILEQQ